MPRIIKIIRNQTDCFLRINPNKSDRLEISNDGVCWCWAGQSRFNLVDFVSNDGDIITAIDDKGELCFGWVRDLCNWQKRY